MPAKFEVVSLDVLEILAFNAHNANQTMVIDVSMCPVITQYYYVCATAQIGVSM